MAGEAPAAKRVLAIRSMETKLVMHWMRGFRFRTAERAVQALSAHPFSSSSLGLFPSAIFSLLTSSFPCLFFIWKKKSYLLSVVPKLFISVMPF